MLIIAQQMISLHIYTHKNDAHANCVRMFGMLFIRCFFCFSSLTLTSIVAFLLLHCTVAVRHSPNWPLERLRTKNLRMKKVETE